MVLQFKELNSRLNKEVAEFEAAQRFGTHYLVDAARDIYQPEPDGNGEAVVHVLGGSGIPLSNSIEDRRRRAFEAAISRVTTKEEEELEQSCGTAKPSGAM